jgi:DNA-directed RNA polymerase specialized sigma24 family protein
VSASGLSRYRAERLLRKDFAGLRAKVIAVVRAQLRGKGVELDRVDLEACYAQAWHGLYATVLSGETVESPSAWLVLVTFRRAIDEARAASRTGVGAELDGAAAIDGRVGASDPDFASALDDRARLRQVFEGLRTRLSERECEAASLCYLQGLTRAEAAERMGISEARMGKLMEGAGAARPGVAGKVGGLLDTIRAGGWCEEQGSLMRAYAFGILDPEGERHALAVAHCRECPACRAHVASLRGLASVLPLPLLSPAALAGAGASGVAGGTAGTGIGSTRLSASGLRIGGRAVGGRGGLSGSLTAKLAVTALVMLGAGYAVFGTRAHGSPRAVHTVRATPPKSSAAFAQALLPTIAVAAHRGHTQHSQALKQRTPARGSRSARTASSHEFLPERLPRESAGVVSPSAPTPVSSPAGSSRAPDEFGIE